MMEKCQQHIRVVISVLSFISLFFPSFRRNDLWHTLVSLFSVVFSNRLKRTQRKGRLVKQTNETSKKIKGKLLMKKNYSWLHFSHFSIRETLPWHSQQDCSGLIRSFHLSNVVQHELLMKSSCRDCTSVHFNLYWNKLSWPEPNPFEMRRNQQNLGPEKALQRLRL